MADRYLLESGAPDGYLLEDGTGVLLVDAVKVFGAFDLPLAATIGTAGRVRAKAAFALPLDATITTAGRLRAKGGLTLPLTLTVVTNGVRTAYGVFDLPITLDVAAAGKVKARSALTLPLILDISVNGVILGAAPPPVAGFVPPGVLQQILEKQHRDRLAREDEELLTLLLLSEA